MNTAPISQRMLGLFERLAPAYRFFAQSTYTRRAGDPTIIGFAQRGKRLRVPDRGQLWHGERRHTAKMFLPRTKRLGTGGEDRDARTFRQNGFCQRRTHGKKVFAIVENDQMFLGLKRLGD